MVAIANTEAFVKTSCKINSTQTQNTNGGKTSLARMERKLGLTLYVNDCTTSGGEQPNWYTCEGYRRGEDDGIDGEDITTTNYKKLVQTATK